MTLTTISRIKIRSQVKQLIQKYFKDENFIDIDMPILTTCVKDISEQTFYIKKPYSLILDRKESFNGFSSPVYLTTSHQLHLQTQLSGLSKVYTEGPLFNTLHRTGKVSSEYWAYTCEESHLEGRQGLNDLLDRAESFLKRILNEIYINNSTDLHQSHYLKEFLSQHLDSKFSRITYSEALHIMKKSLAINSCNSIASKGKKAISDYFNNSPVFITDFPMDQRSFNCSCNEATDTVNAFMLLLPHVGDLISGAVRETNHELLVRKLEKFDAMDYYSWFSDATKWGSTPSGGFTLGLDRLLSIIFHNFEIRKINTFPIPGSS